MNSFFHSVRLDEEKCMGCTNCIKRCPTQAIRVRNGKANIISELCIDCGECIRVCPHHAKYAERDSMNRILEFKHRIALPAPALYGQFNNLDDIGYIITALKLLGFDEVFEVSRGAELVSEATRRYLEENKIPKPVISSACPAVCRLIRICFPNLIPHVLPLNSPMEEAARLAREEAIKKTGLPSEDIGVFFITPCPAKITAIKQPICLPQSNVDGAIAMKDLYPVLLKQMNHLGAPDDSSNSGIIGVSWASSGGEAAALLKERYLAADGIENVIKVLEEIEDEKLDTLDFIELNACSGGCVGGSLTAENPYVAKARLQQLRRYLPVSANHLMDEGVPQEMEWQRPLEGLSVLKLAENVSDAMAMMKRIKEIQSRLPGLDCGTCGAPSCRALAEDIVRGNATLHDCVFSLRNELSGTDMQEFIPAPFRNTDAEKEE
ncbi:MAG: 4Fe-4S binding protein [Clostridia bacterium]|nr:4Fe-4S binding protein [Clostridia bacterium]